MSHRQLRNSLVGLLRHRELKAYALWVFGAALFLGLGAGLFLVQTSTRKYRNQQTMVAYAQELAAASRPGDNVRKLIADQASGAPIVVFAKLQQNLRQRWHHVPDAEGEDHAKLAETSATENPPSGDCEDEAVLLLAIARAMNFVGRTVLATNGPAGHVWAEVRISRRHLLSEEEEEGLRELFPETAIVQDDLGLWLRLETPSVISNYKPHAWVNDLGELRPVTYR